MASALKCQWTAELVRVITISPGYHTQVQWVTLAARIGAFP